MLELRQVDTMNVKLKKLKKTIKNLVRHRRYLPQSRIHHPGSECMSIEGQNVCKHTLKFVEDKYVLSTVPWYWPQIGCESATSIIKLCPDGTFLVRKSETAGYAFSLTYKVGGVVGNARVHCKNGLFGLCHDDKVQPREPTLIMLIERLMDTKEQEQLVMVHRKAGDSAKIVPLKLEHPLQRNISLMDHCRKVIMRSIDKPEDVWQFDIPRNLRMFLLELNSME